MFIVGIKIRLTTFLFSLLFSFFTMVPFFKSKSCTQNSTYPVKGQRDKNLSNSNKHTFKIIRYTAVMKMRATTFLLLLLFTFFTINPNSCRGLSTHFCQHHFQGNAHPLIESVMIIEFQVMLLKSTSLSSKYTCVPQPLY